MRLSAVFLYNFLLLLFSVLRRSAALESSTACDILRTQKANELHGSVQSPNYPNAYPGGLQCLFTFIARPGYRVRLQFKTFSLTGSLPSCQIDHLDVYSELKSESVRVVRDGHLSGRFCGSVSPRLVISLHNIAVLVFHTRPDSPGREGFHIDYEFMPESFFVPGEKDPSNEDGCGFTIRSWETGNLKGSINSPTYPGAYPANLHCFYRLIGTSGQRILLRFDDFDLFFGGIHCPYDHVIIYDGDSRKDPIIKKICGLQQKLFLYSGSNQLYIEFNTTEPEYSQHRGFKIRYEFSSEFVDVGKMISQGESHVHHIRGTECDLRITSGKATHHYIRSPNYPAQYPLNKTCTYVLDGRQSTEDLEKVILRFESFNIVSAFGKCDDASLAVYNWGQKPQTENPDERYCGEGLPPDLKADGPRLVLVFRSGSMTARGFVAQVFFETDFGILGEQTKSSDICDFRFKSITAPSGFFNSPRHPLTYPNNQNCTYRVIGKQGEQIHLGFEEFQLQASETCDDFLEVYDVYPNGLPEGKALPSTGPGTPYLLDSGGKQVEILTGRYCPNRVPGRIISDRGANQIRLVFSADKKDNSVGFKAVYEFKPEKPLFDSERTNSGCGGLIEGKSGGVITSPNFGTRYDKNLNCNWVIKVRPGYRILLTLQKDQFKVEGEIKIDTDNNFIRGDCGHAVLRIYSNLTGPAMGELCGTDDGGLCIACAVKRELVSDENEMRLSFITDNEVNGLVGFKLSWSEVRKGECDDETEFKCLFNHWCIASGDRCNDVANCGRLDDSDEHNCDVPEENGDAAIIIPSIALVCTSSLLGYCRNRPRIILCVLFIFYLYSLV